MTLRDCSEEQLVLVSKFFRALRTAKIRIVEPVIVTAGLTEEDEFMARMGGDLLFDIDVIIPKGKERADWLKELKQSLHTYISSTSRDTEEYHRAIDTMKFPGVEENG